MVGIFYLLHLGSELTEKNHNLIDVFYQILVKKGNSHPDKKKKLVNTFTDFTGMARISNEYTLVSNFENRSLSKIFHSKMYLKFK